MSTRTTRIVSSRPATRRVAPPQEEQPRSRTGLIVGIIIGVIVLIIIIIVIIVLVSRGGDDTTPPTNMCTTTADCPGLTVCNTATGNCVTCIDNTTCSGATPVCNTTTNSCVECVNAGTDCPAGFLCQNNVCVPPPCMSDADCSGTPSTPACNTVTGNCVVCTATNETACSGATPVCNDTTNQCVECNVPGDCPALFTCDPINNTCVPPECTMEPDPACTGMTPFCDVGVGLCVQCLVGGDCASGSCTQGVCDCIAAVTPNVVADNGVVPSNSQSLSVTWPADGDSTASNIIVSMNPDMSDPLPIKALGPASGGSAVTVADLGLEQTGSSMFAVLPQFFSGETFYVQVEQENGPTCSVLGGIVDATFTCPVLPASSFTVTQQPGRPTTEQAWDFIFDVAPIGGAGFDVQIYASRVPNFDLRQALYTTIFSLPGGVGPHGFFWGAGGSPSFNIPFADFPLAGETIYFVVLVKPAGSTACWSAPSPYVSSLIVPY